MVRGQMLAGKTSDVKDEDLPTTYDDIFGEPEKVEESRLFSFDEIDDRMGWGRKERAAPVDLLSMDEINERMGW